MFLVDTNVLSELVANRPNAGVVRWAASVDERLLSISVVTIAEMRHGVQLLPAGRRREALEISLVRQIIPRFRDRTLPVTVDIADQWGRCITVARRTGYTIGAMDGLIGATALVHDLTVVTRNVADFEPLGVPVLNPWDV
jgi:hypothetical protein